MRTLGLIVREKSEFKENVYAVTDRQTDDECQRPLIQRRPWNRVAKFDIFPSRFIIKNRQICIFIVIMLIP